MQPPPAGNQADARLHQAHVRFGGRLRARGVQHELAAAAERHPERRGHDRLRRVLDRHARVLEAADGRVELVPLAFLRGEQHQHQIRADAEVLALVADHHRLVIARGLLDGGADHLHRVVAQRVHLAVELEAEDAVAEIDQ